ncbi:sugar transporter SWEET1-like [Macrosteles quadrilineatus]|uniref:sugar transporter SWEET1-like n=1 Tax=Macrosteles quadrilineatus TaxID=74068 RepID=UPI0023E159D2|nr:sugar transporter SWEET1-like [Macrosteles quadrilineatus]XP_054271471.1 sugar transporter SWEET1-like [Macrosteles quadrilineatus]XP_054272308.1 sugar transporter SWEET1-like [Macrosteles quadrilineatus]XP_054272309.1 sugar transporter SWEET1-like [Macrosteles quadrilineatus]
MSLDFIDIPDAGPGPGNLSQGFQLSDHKEMIATTASISTILQFLSGALVCNKFVQKGTTSDVSCLQFVAGFLSCGLWLSYGLLIDDSSIVLVNSVGTILFMCYIFIFYTYTLRKNAVVKQVMAVLMVMVSVRLYAYWVSDITVARTHLGLVACSTTIMFFSAPLTNLAYVLRVKSAESLPFPMILMTFLVSFQWFLYGIILENPIIQYPNIVGCLLSLFQLSLFVIYPAR